MIFDYVNLGLSGEALANILTPLCAVVLDRDVCRGAIDNYLVNKHIYRVEEKYATAPKSKIFLRVFRFFPKPFCY